MGLFKGITNSYHDKLDRATRKKESIERVFTVNSINYDTDSGIHRMIQDVLKTNYLDIFVYTNRIQAAYSTLYFKDYGKSDIQLDEAKKLAAYIKKRLNTKYSYRIQPLYDVTGKGGATSGNYGLNQRGSVEWFSGDSSSGYGIVGWRIHNENYNLSSGIFKEWDKEKRRYRQWDVKNRRYLD